MTPTEKDAMALAVLRENADDIGRCAAIFRESHMAAAFALTADQMDKASVEIAEARAHLASRIAQQAERIAQLEANENTMLRNFNRAEADLAEAQKNTKALYAWIFLALNEGANRITVSPAKFWSVVRANPEIQMRQSPSGDTLQLVAIDAARGGE